MTGQGAFDAKGGRSRMVLTFPGPDSAGPAEMEAIVDGTVMYMHSELFDSLPDGAEWMSLDFSLGEDPELPLPADGDATGELELLEEATGDVQKLGKEDVHGVSTTRYRGTVGVAENAERLREAGGEDLATLVEEKGGPSQVEAWVDASGRVRRMRVVSVQPRQEGEGPTTIDMRMGFFDFGAIPQIEVPDSSEVFDATALAKNELGISNDE